ncbi:MAG: RnfABCDGE type electron transport complex subunit G [Synergistaceae bacterium]|nr:RnfABCDGE type electron transport complex subunit G [Synergistaceae bacterium]
MAKIIRLGAVLFLITVVTGIILGGVHTMTLEPIRQAKEREKMEALAATLPAAKEFKAVEVSGKPEYIKEVNAGTDNGQLMGYNITVSSKGYGGMIDMVVGISSGGDLMGIKILSHSETPGLGARAPEPAFSGQFKDKKAAALSIVKTAPSSDSEIQAISGATITSTAVTTGVNQAVDFWKNNLKDGAKPVANSQTPDAISSSSRRPGKVGI